MWLDLWRAIIWSRVTPSKQACMMGHWGVVSCQRRWVSSGAHRDRLAHAQIAMEFAVHDEDAAPNDVAGLAEP